MRCCLFVFVFEAEMWYNQPMFTGIIEETGKIQAIDSKSVVILCREVLGDTKIGDSISVNGVCLTVTGFGKDFFKADVSGETFRVTAFSKLKSGSVVNLERAMPACGRFGGHIVSGHIDGIAKVRSITNNKEFYDLELELCESESKYTVKKGSITVNGVSLTVAGVNKNFVNIALIPHTYEQTNFSELKSGDYVNIEVDIMAKYIEKFLSTGDNRSGVDMDFLQRNGFC